MHIKHEHRINFKKCDIRSKNIGLKKNKKRIAHSVALRVKY